MEELLRTIDKAGRALSINELAELTGRTRKDIQKDLEQLVKEFQLVQAKGNKFALPKQIGVFVGKVSVHQRGFGFLDRGEEDDIFIGAGELNGAMNGDVVSVRTHKGRKSGKQEGTVVEVLEHANTTLVGTVSKREGGYWLSPQDRKIPDDLYIDYMKDAKVDDVVSLQITKYPVGNKPGAGRVLSVIGNKDDNRIDILSAIASFNIPTEFKAKTLKEAKEIDTRVAPEKGRVDFRDVLTITIDGADAKDLDDAVSLEKAGDNFVLTVHIADVSHYVLPGSSLDQEASFRGNSVYFPGRVIPMLPKELSNGICSLNEKVDRFVTSCRMTVDRSGQVIDSQISKGLIHSDHRMTYDDVNKILAGDRELCQRYADIVDMLHDLKHLQQILLNERLQRGSLEFELPEAAFTINEDGSVENVYAKQRGIAERMIEECMLLANKTVCKFMEKRNLPIVFRVHEPPNEEKIETFSAFVSAYGFRFHKDKVTPKAMQNVQTAAQGTPYQEAVSLVMLRSLSKAKYSTVNYGHFGLAFEDYCHFTSPIRRYADLLIHRFLADHLMGRASKTGNLAKTATHISETEQSAMEAERYVDDIYRCYYMQRFVGDEFEGKVSGMNGAGMYVELPNTCEGMVRLASIRGDYFIFQEKLFQLIGEHSRKIFRMGDKVRVVITAVNPELGQIDMELIEDQKTVRPGGNSRPDGSRSRRPGGGQAAERPKGQGGNRRRSGRSEQPKRQENKAGKSEKSPKAAQSGDNRSKQNRNRRQKKK